LSEADLENVTGGVIGFLASIILTMIAVTAAAGAAVGVVGLIPVAIRRRW
jgi:heme/copper-type cytochrome/quinol oxidase subunit 4